MKKPETTSKKPAPKAEQPIKTQVTKTTPKKPTKTKATKATPKKPTKTEATIATPKKPTKAVATKTTSKKSNPPPKKAQAAAPKAVEAMSEKTVPERIGLTAGSIWQYLDQNGATTVAKLIRELTEEEKIIQRSIGWLAQEGKITLDTINRVETIALKD